MYRRKVVLSPLARACQTGALLLILFGVLGLLAHTIVAERKPEQVVGTKHGMR